MHPVAVDHLEICSISLNFEPERADKGKAVLSVMFVHRPTNFKHNEVYDDATALEFWQTNGAALERAVMQKLIADGKLPEGTVVE